MISSYLDLLLVVPNIFSVCLVFGTFLYVHLINQCSHMLSLRASLLVFIILTVKFIVQKEVCHD